MSEKQINISERLRMLAGMVTPGNRVADIGCDHGFLPIYLYQAGRIPSALAMDVRKGPLEACAGHVAECGLEEYIEVRLSDGLKSYREGEADTIVCAGMGGRLMEKILTESLPKARAAKELILQPQSEIGEFRAFLRKSGFRIVCEDAVCEDGKYYFAMRAVPEREAGQEKSPETKAGSGNCPDEVMQDRDRQLCDCFGEKLLSEKNPVLLQFLLYRKQVLKDVASQLLSADTDRQRKRLEEIQGELEMVERALSRFEI
jgi:tRNA (adenine22-N1)-methyltransferase